MDMPIELLVLWLDPASISHHSGMTGLITSGLERHVELVGESAKFILNGSPALTFDSRLAIELGDAVLEVTFEACLVVCEGDLRHARDYRPPSRPVNRAGVPSPAAASLVLLPRAARHARLRAEVAIVAGTVLSALDSPHDVRSRWGISR
jgi:hypothetical protein